MPLKMTETKYFEVDYDDLEEFFLECYPVFTSYEFVAIEECDNDSQHSFTVDGELGDYELEDWDEMVQNKKIHKYSNYLLLNKLCADGHIPAGEYLINVSW